MSDGPKSPWVRLHAGYQTDGRILALNDDVEAELLYLRALAWAKAHSVDGVVDMGALPWLTRSFRDANRAVSHLLDVGLWINGSDTYYVIRNWQRWQGDAATLDDYRAHERERKRRARQRDS